MKSSPDTLDVLSMIRATGDERPCLLHFNGDFEYELASGLATYRPSPFLLEMNRQLAPLMGLLGTARDRLFDPAGRPDAAPGSHRYVPWGVTPSTLREAAQVDPEARFPTVEAVRRIQDRRFGLALEQALNIGLPGSRTVTSLETLEEAVKAARGPFVLKHPFGVAGRERAFGRPGALTEGARRWCVRALETIGVLVLEPWMDRVRDLGVQWWVPESGLPSLLGILELLTDANGAYRGHRVGEIAIPDGLIDTTREIALQVQREGYFGPLGIDAFGYRAPDGAIRLRPLVELNARFTMGMAALGLRRLVGEDRVGEWVHHDARGGVPPAIQHSLEADPYDPDRRQGALLTSPRIIGGRPAARLSILTVRPSGASSTVSSDWGDSSR